MPLGLCMRGLRGSVRCVALVSADIELYVRCAIADECGIGNMAELTHAIAIYTQV